MHDPTEGGLAAGLHELAEASGLAIVIDPSAIAWYPPAMAVIEAAGANPWATLASGTLLATFGPDQAVTTVTELRRLGHLVAVVGESRVRFAASQTCQEHLSRGPSTMRWPDCSTSRTRPLQGEPGVGTAWPHEA